jgi:hypothetical protein
MHTLTLVLAAMLLGPRQGSDDPGVAAIRLIREKNAGWPRTLTFVQTTTFPDGRVQTWYESARLPGQLRIDIAPLEEGNASIFRADSQYQIRGGEVRNAVPLVHVLLLLAYDARVDPVERTVRRLREVGFDLGKAYPTDWEGRPVTVIGTTAPDSLANQFWVDRERGVVVRVLHAPSGRPADFRLSKFARMATGWMESRIEFYRLGRLVLREEYRDIRMDVVLGDSVFQPGTPAPGWTETAR